MTLGLILGPGEWLGSLAGVSLGRIGGSDKLAAAEHSYLPTAQSRPANNT